MENILEIFVLIVGFLITYYGYKKIQSKFYRGTWK